MSRYTWYLIKHNKNFNVRVFRKGITVLIGSLVLNILFGMLLFYKYKTMPERDFYATNGATPPVELKPLLAPNTTSTALLEPDPQSVTVEKTIPQ